MVKVRIFLPQNRFNDIYLQKASQKEVSDSPRGLLFVPSRQIPPNTSFRLERIILGLNEV